MEKKTIVVAFSGGLDTSYLAAWLKETTQARVVTVTVDTGGFSKAELKEIAERSAQVGADQHVTQDGRQETFDRVVKTLIHGNVLRGQAYPLCVSAERVTQAEILVRTARELSAEAIAHGSTGAGNDQVRFDVAIRTLAPELEILTPIRDQALSREQETQWLRDHGIPVTEQTAIYSINAGMWGVTIGGGQIHDAWCSIPDKAYPNVIAIEQAPAQKAELEIAFEQGVPVSLNEENFSGPALVDRLNHLGAQHGVGRGIHVGDTIFGIKGRIAFEAPAAFILVAAHRELEKLVLSRWQLFWKEKLADFYGMLLHEGQIYDPVVADLTAMLESSQSRVTGAVRVSLGRGICTVEGARSPFSLLEAAEAIYGETQSLWSGRDAAGFTKIYGLQGRLARGLAQLEEKSASQKIKKT